MKKVLLLMILSCFTAVSFAQTPTPTDGDYRSVATGNWTALSTWQERVSGEWVAATSAPTSSNNVYLQTGYVVNVDAENVYCNDLHWGFTGTTYGSVRLNTSYLNVSGKVRVYTNHTTPFTATGPDLAFYSGQTNSTSTNTAQFTAPTTLGFLKFVGDTRDITKAGEWNGNGTVCYGIFALNPGQTGRLYTGMKFRGLEFFSGNIISYNGLIAVGSGGAGNGDVVFQSGVKFTTSRSNQAITQASGVRCGNVEIKAGATVEFTDNDPEINCTNFINNGTIIYSGNAQNLVKPNSAIVTSDASVNPLTNYQNLTVSVGTSLTLPLNKNITLGGVLNFTSGKLIIPASTSLALTNANTAVTGASATSYIQTSVSGSVSGILKVSDLSTTNTFPVGTASHYAPVTLAPAASSNFDINVFAGATADATPNGTALIPAQKLRMVDAVWNISRNSGSGDVNVILGWDNTLEGADFSVFNDAQIGVAGYVSGNYGTFSGSGNAANNTATITTNTFSPFIVGEANTTLPLTLLSFTVRESLNSVKLAWQTTDEVNLKNYVLQHQTANGFQDIYTVAANNKVGVFSYNYTHLNPKTGINYYRLVGVDFDGTTHPSEIKPVVVSLSNAVTIYPNPVSQSNISVSGVVKGDIIKLLNIQGEVIATKAASGSSIEVIEVQNIQAGTYILSVENAGKITSTKKVIKI